MTQLTKYQLSDMLALGTAMRGMATGCTSMEEVARRIVGYLYEALPDESGKSALVLARLYKTHRSGDLDPTLRAFASDVMGSSVDADTRSLVLLATRGSEPAWNERSSSSGHKAIPLPDPEFIARLPMVCEVFRQFGVELSDVVGREKAAQKPPDKRSYGVFLVESALGSPHIPAQTDFVVRHGVRSVMAFGGDLPNGDMFVTLLFSRVEIGRQLADLFSPLSLSVKLALLPFSHGRTFA